MMTRRHFLVGAGATAASAIGISGYAFGVEPMMRLDVVEYVISPPGWPRDFPLTIALLADVHAIEPWMPPSRIADIVRFTNRLRPDLVLLGGDYECNLGPIKQMGRRVPMAACAAALAGLRAPLGIQAILGNHDVWRNRAGTLRTAFATNGIPILENRATRLEKDGRGFWILGLGDQIGYWTPDGFRPLDDLPGTLAQVTDDAPAILLAHEPDIFHDVPARIALTLAGHTHGGQVSLPLVGPLVVPSKYGRRYVYGHVSEKGRDLVVSGGLGLSTLPVRFGVPPEVVMIRLGQRSETSHAPLAA
jgi:predicted MPP superfamily phosphohydrolase